MSDNPSPELRAAWLLTSPLFDALPAKLDGEVRAAFAAAIRDAVSARDAETTAIVTTLVDALRRAEDQFAMPDDWPTRLIDSLFGPTLTIKSVSLPCSTCIQCGADKPNSRLLFCDSCTGIDP